MRDFRNLTLMDHLYLVWRRKWYFIIPTLLIPSLGVLYALSIPHAYRSETRIAVESAIISEPQQNNAHISNQERINSVQDQLQSRTFAERVIEEFQLFGYGRAPKLNMDYAVDEFRTLIQVKSASDNSFIISFTALDPELARAVTKRLADLLIRITQSAQETRFVSADQFLDSQMQQAKLDLKESEAKIREFKNAHSGELPEQSGMNVTALSQLQTQLTTTDSMIQNALDQGKLLDIRLQEQEQLSNLSHSTSRAEDLPKESGREARPDPVAQQFAEKKSLLSEYLAKYTPDYPDVKRLKREIAELEQQIARRAAEQEKAPAALSSAPPNSQPGGPAAIQINISIAQIKAEIESRDRDIQRRTKEREDIQRQIREYQARLGRGPGLEQELLALERENEILRQKYDNLQSRKFSAQLAASLITSKTNETYRVMDEANLPERPEPSKRRQIALISLVAGIGIGLGAVYGREYMAGTVSTTEEVQQLLGLPVLALVPDLPSKEERKSRAHA
jgi:polysaccharide biosynthesis transport protein